MKSLIIVLRALAKLMLSRGSVRSYSQLGEDAVLLNLLRNRRHGFYVDVGCFHPIQYSNTYAFYRRGWNGIVIDPNPELRVLYRVFRPRDVFVESGVSLSEETRKYFNYKDGAYNTFDPAQVIELENSKGIVPVKEAVSPVRTLRSILSEYRVDKIDLLTIDVEGLDLSVLQSHEWSIRPDYICIEDHAFNPEHPEEGKIFGYLRDRSYKLTAIVGFSLIFKAVQA